MSNSQLSRAKDGSRHGAFQPNSEPKDLLINTTVQFWGKKYIYIKWEQRKRGCSKRCHMWHLDMKRDSQKKYLICVAASWIPPFPTLYPARTSEWTLHSVWHCWLLANHFNGIQTKIPSLIIIKALNMNYRRAIFTVAMVSNYKWFVLKVDTLPNLPC